jgi:hypothetical protein
MAPDGKTTALIVVAVVLVAAVAGLAVWVGIDQTKLKRRQQIIQNMRKFKSMPGAASPYGPGPVVPPTQKLQPAGPGPVNAPSHSMGAQGALGFSQQGAATPQCFNQNLVGAFIAPADSKQQGNYTFNMSAPTSKPVPLSTVKTSSARRVGQAGVQSQINLAAYEHMGGAAGVSTLDTPEELMVGALLAGTQEMAPVTKNETWDVRGEVPPGQCNGGGGKGSWYVGYSKDVAGNLQIGPGAFTSQIGPYSLGSLPSAGMF